VKRFFIRTRYILIFFVLLSAATVFSYIDLSPEVAKPEQNLSEMMKQNTLQPKVEESERAPASVSDSSRLQIGSAVLCRHGSYKTGVSHSVGRRLVMLDFKVCPGLEDLAQKESFKLENTSNGFKAQIFRIDRDNFKTDYIQLNEGLNKLSFEVVLKDGQKRIESLDILSGS
jgi:hypothetical protein